MKIDQAKKFLAKGYKIRVTILFWGKHSDRKNAINYGGPKLEKFKEIGKVLQEPQTVGRRMTMMIG